MSVLVLMSTYNGEKYLRTQLDSILNQTYKDIDILIRDDGSSDGTRDILENYASEFPQIKWYGGLNIGVSQSFFELIRNAELTYEYYAFADQDDEWLPKKIEKAVNVLKHNTTLPMLYCSDKIIVNQDLMPIRVTVSRVMKQASFGNALVQDMCTGCTAVMNRKLLSIIRKRTPDYVIMHDWWFYLTATCFGAVYYDVNSYIKYRQHNNNTSGAMLTKKALLKYRLRQLLCNRGEIYKQAQEFKTIFRDDFALCSVGYKENEQLLDELLAAQKAIWARLKLVLDKRVFRQKQSDDLVFRLIVLMGKL